MSNGLNILVTRPEPDAESTAEKLSGLGIASICAPLMRMLAITTELPQPTDLSAIALTSANAVRALETTALLAPYLHLPVFTVGDRTAAHARAAGFKTVTSADGSFVDLVALLTREKPQGPIFYPTTPNATGDLSNALAPQSTPVITAHVYEMQTATDLPATTTKALQTQTINAAMFYSRRTAETFCSLTKDLTDQAKHNLTMLCLSENVASPLIANGFPRIALADYPSEEAMMALAASLAHT